MRIPVGDLSQYGIVKDIRDNMLPANAWTDGKNVRFYDGKVMTARGGSRIMDPPPIPPYWLMYVFSPFAGHFIWIGAGLNKVYAFDTTAWFNITRQTTGADVNYTATKWNGGNLAGIPVLNNGFDLPQYWSAIDSSIRLANLTNWPTTWRTKVMRPYLNFLLALNMTESGVNYPHRFRWSQPAQPNGIPVTWDETDPTKQAGISELMDVFSGSIIDGLPLRDAFIIYKERATWGMRFTGGIYVMNIYPIFHDTGILSQDCACTFGEPSEHFVFTGEDLIVHDGQNLQSVANKKVRRWIMSNIDKQNFANSYVVPYTDQNEIWTCIPTQGNIYPDTAVVWNLIDGSFSLRALKNAAFITPGVIPSLFTVLAWNVATQTWDSSIQQWSPDQSPAYRRALLQADPIDVATIQLDTTQQYLGVNYDCRVERTGLAVAGVSSDGEPISNKDIRKLVRGAWVSASGGPFGIQVARQHELEGPITWGTVYPFNPGSDVYVGVLDDTDDQACRLFGLRFLWTSQSQGELNSIDLDIEPLGEW